jgi:DNA invertase Pin-like site-specific DNA recombinase
MSIGYARVSTIDQNTDLQTDELETAGCQKIFIDKISGVKSDRPELNKLGEQLREGDTLVVWRLDRLGRSLKDLIDWMNYLEKQKVVLKSLQESIDTRNPRENLFSTSSEPYQNLREI